MKCQTASQRNTFHLEGKNKKDAGKRDVTEVLRRLVQSEYDS